MTEAKHWFWVLLDVFIAALIIAVMGVGLPSLVRFSSSFAPARTITVTAEGKTTATPDLAEVSFSVVSQGQNPQTLSQNNTDKMNAVLQFVSSENIASSDIATTAYDLEPNYQYDKDTQTNFITGYTLTQTVTLKVHDLSNVATVLGGLAPLGVNQIGGVNFTFNDSDNLLGTARADAIGKAQAQAEAMASEAGATLGGVVNISEDGVFPQPVRVYNMAEGSAAAPMAASTPDIEPGSQDITDNVTITYALR
jgi:uncharacterized protein YggE